MKKNRRNILMFYRQSIVDALSVLTEGEYVPIHVILAATRIKVFRRSEKQISLKEFRSLMLELIDEGVIEEKSEKFAIGPCQPKLHFDPAFVKGQETSLHRRLRLIQRRINTYAAREKEFVNDANMIATFADNLPPMFGVATLFDRLPPNWKEDKRRSDLSYLSHCLFHLVENKQIMYHELTGHFGKL